MLIVRYGTCAHQRRLVSHHSLLRLCVLSTDHETIHVVTAQNLGRPHSLLVQSCRPEVFSSALSEVGHRVARSHPVVQILDFRRHCCLDVSLEIFNEVERRQLRHVCIKLELFLGMPYDVLPAPVFLHEVVSSRVLRISSLYCTSSPKDEA